MTYIVGYYLRHRFGPQVKTEFLDLALAGNRQQYAEVIQAVEEHKLPLPLVAIDGVVKMAGAVDYHAIEAAVDALRGKSETPA